ncbi:MAG TPA: hypothetical protein VMZ71_05335 [Gemmataceae bacterium]|nr:hypothetical protein [Gemmataceae bacterium]
MIRAVERVRERCLRSARALEAAGIPYAVAGGNAVAHWVATIDEGAVRNTPDVDVLIRRADLEAVKTAMTGAGFVYAPTSTVELFVDGPDGKPRDGIHLFFAGEKAKPDDPLPAAEMSETEQGTAFRVVSLEALVRMKLVAFRLKDRVHVRDMIDVGLIDATWPDRFPPPLDDRLREILADPEG